jgi:hypothetical protein
MCFGREMIHGGDITEQQFELDIAHWEDADILMPSPISWAA